MAVPLWPVRAAITFIASTLLPMPLQTAYTLAKTGSLALDANGKLLGAYNRWIPYRRTKTCSDEPSKTYNELSLTFPWSKAILAMYLQDAIQIDYSSWMALSTQWIFGQPLPSTPLVNGYFYKIGIGPLTEHDLCLILF